MSRQIDGILVTLDGNQPNIQSNPKKRRNIEFSCDMNEKHYAAFIQALENLIKQHKHPQFNGNDRP